MSGFCHSLDDAASNFLPYPWPNARDMQTGMSKQLKTPPGSRSPTPAERRTQKLEAALRLNLKKRKDQSRERTTTDGENGADPDAVNRHT